MTLTPMDVRFRVCDDGIGDLHAYLREQLGDRDIKELQAIGHEADDLHPRAQIGVILMSGFMCVRCAAAYVELLP